MLSPLVLQTSATQTLDHWGGLGVFAMTEQGELVEISRICALLNISRTSFWRLSRQAGFPTPIRLGRLVRYYYGDVLSFLSAHSRGCD
jgi:predicted DNA-binding transcriptional regulator AlpA